MTLCGHTSTHVPHSQQLPYATTSFIICLKDGWRKLGWSIHSGCGIGADISEPLSGVSTSRRPAPDAISSRVLSSAELRTLRALADALVPRGGPFALGADDVGTAERIGDYLARLTPATRQQIRLLVRAWDAGPLASRHLRPFHRLSPEARAAWLDACETSRLPWRRAPLLLLKTLCLTAFCADPRVEEALGYTHACLDAREPRPGRRLAPLQWPDVADGHEETADVCIVGSGAGGAVVAHELAAAGRRVVILEEGAYFTQADFTGPPFERVQRMYRNGGAMVALGRPTLPLPLGRAVGGTTVVNSGTCFRTPDRVLRAWEADEGLDGIDPAAMAPYFAEVERAI